MVDDEVDDGDDTFSDIDRTNLQVSFFLLVCSAVASIIMIGCYYCQKSRAPRLLLWLFGSNFLWFASFLVFYFLTYVRSPEMEHQTTCTYLTAFYDFFLNFSMLWPSVICFDLWMNTRDPRWRWDSPQSIENWYMLIVVALAAIAPLSIALFPSKKYCDLTHYTPPTQFFGIGIEFVLPMCAFIFNCGVILVVRRSLKQEMPFSVRTRRRRQMHNYVLVWMFCWGPYLAHEIYFFTQTSQQRNHPSSKRDQMNKMFFLIRNATLYSTGSFDLLVYGMENAWLKRSLRMVCDSIRLTDLCCMEDVQASYLKNTNDKSVTFGADVPQAPRAEVSKQYVTRRLSKPDKYRLYQFRPDLDPNRSLESLNPIPSADVHYSDPRFKKTMLDQRVVDQGAQRPGPSSEPLLSHGNHKSSSSSSSSRSKRGTENGRSGNHRERGKSNSSRRSDSASSSSSQVSSLQERDHSFEPPPFSHHESRSQQNNHQPQTATLMEQDAPSPELVVRDTLTFFRETVPTSEEVIRTELMEEQEFGISPHKRAESLQRAAQQNETQAETSLSQQFLSPQQTSVSSTDSLANASLLSPLVWNQSAPHDPINMIQSPDNHV